MSARSAVLVAAQFVCIVLLALTGPLVPSALPLQIAGGGGILLGAWAVWVMKPGRFRITPDVSPNARLVTKGPYRHLRHPMYASALLVTLVWVLGSVRLLRALIWFGLLITLILKLVYEERLLAQRFTEYEAYQHSSWRLLPFVW